jgi:predicted ArsR family transcriptional regulator
VDELASALSLTENAVRNHLTSLERDGLVSGGGVRRGAGAGKPATVYQLQPQAEVLLSRAYPPVLGVLLDVLGDRLPAEQAEELLREVGRRIAKNVGGRATGDEASRTRSAAAALNALGGDAVVVENAASGELTIRGAGCPLSAAVAERPECCLAIESLIHEITGLPTQSRCLHGARPSCCFVVATEPAASSSS